MADQQFCLRWNNHQNTLISVFDTLLEGGILVDCTLAAEGKFLRAHKVVLSACSPFFSDLLRQHYEQHPILIMKDVKFEQLKAMLDYMYRGEVNISQDQLSTFLKAAESLQIKGLSDSNHGHTSEPKAKSSIDNRNPRTSKSEEEATALRLNNTSPTLRRKRRRLTSGSGDDNIIEEISSERTVESNTPPPPRISVSSRLSNPPSPPLLSRDENTISPEEVIHPTSSRPLPVPNLVTYSKGDYHHQPHPLMGSMLFEPKSEFIELDDEENMANEDDAAEAGPSHKNDGNFSWHMERPEDAFLSQESLSGQRNAQGTLLYEGRQKLAFALKQLTETLQKPLPEGAVVMEELAVSIASAIDQLGDSRPTAPRPSEPSCCPNNNQNAHLEVTPNNEESTTARMRKQRPGPRSQKKRLKNGQDLQEVSNFSAFSKELDVGNKIWMRPVIPLTDVLKSRKIKKEIIGPILAN